MIQPPSPTNNAFRCSAVAAAMKESSGPKGPPVSPGTGAMPLIPPAITVVGAVGRLLVADVVAFRLADALNVLLLEAVEFPVGVELGGMTVEVMRTVAVATVGWRFAPKPVETTSEVKTVTAFEGV